MELSKSGEIAISRWRSLPLPAALTVAFCILAAFMLNQIQFYHTLLNRIQFHHTSSIPDTRQHLVRSTRSYFQHAYFDNFLNFDKYRSVKDNKFLRFRCNSCALVTGAGHLAGSKKGEEIDATECVIRTNNAPTAEYRTDVGIKTTVRIVGLAAGRIKYREGLENGTIHSSEANGTVVVGWGPPEMTEDGKPYDFFLKNLQRAYPTNEYFKITTRGIKAIDNMYNNITAMDRKKEGAWITTGFFSMVFAQEFCSDIFVYGMADSEFCSRISALNVSDVPYHYYDEGANKKEEGGECHHVQWNEFTSRYGGGHLFEKEREIFGHWAEKDKNIHFMVPVWNLPELLS